VHCRNQLPFSQNAASPSKPTSITFIAYVVTIYCSMVLFHTEILCQPALFINKIDPHHFDHGLHTHNSLGLCDDFVPHPMLWHFVSGSYSNFQDLSQVTLKLRYVNWFQMSDWHLLKLWLSSRCPTARMGGTKFEQTILSNLHEESDAVSPS